MRKALIVVLLTAAVVSAEDSPLVALAKRTNRKATSKTPVITNETVARSKGRLTMAGGDGTTATNAAPTLPPAAAPAPATTTTTTATPTTATAAPVVRTNTATATPPAYPASTARNIDPQSTVQFNDPQASARTIDPTSGAGRIDPQSTAGTIQPATTAQNIPPQSTSAPPR